MELIPARRYVSDKKPGLKTGNNQLGFGEEKAGLTEQYTHFDPPFIIAASFPLIFDTLRQANGHKRSRQSLVRRPTGPRP